MIKYVAIAVALKCFSCCSATRQLYRHLGNRLGGKRRMQGTMPAYYPDRVRRMLHLTRQHSIVRDGDRILELGTGWLHWEAITLRLFFDINAVLYDVWDNRQLGGMKNYLHQFRAILDESFGVSPGQIRHARDVIDKIIKVESFEELYDLLGFEYVVDGSGSLSQFADNSFQLVVSGGVLEHVNRDALPMLISETRRILGSGGWAVHSIDTADHLEHYDRTVSPKFYLRFSESTWRRVFENEVQYINLVQRGEWLELFRKSGFIIVEEEYREVDISRLKISPRFQGMDKLDLATTTVRLAMRR